MTIFRDSSNNTPVTTENVSDLVDQYNSDVVKGYKMALVDIFGEIEQIAFKQPPSVLNPQGTARKLLLDFYVQKRKLLHAFEELGVMEPKHFDTPKS